MDNKPVIIKKVKKASHGGHHGGAWKVAYADFVTAMMAFFLLLWLLNVTTDEQRKGIADYFAPASISKVTSGAGGVLGGQTIVVDGSMVSTNGMPAVVIGMAPMPRQDAQQSGPPSDEDIQRRLAEKEQQEFDKAEAALRQAIQQSPDSAELARHLMIDMTPEGLRIQLVDQDKQSMFPSGSAAMNERARNLMAMVAKVVERLPNKLSISGHTDAQPFRRDAGYGNWELSSDRANASRRALVDSGIDAARIQQVTGRADQEPLISDSPLHASNRRISIVLLRDQPLGKPAEPAPGGAARRAAEPAATPPPPPIRR
jgi:chemotaxis protein MotB